MSRGSFAERRQRPEDEVVDPRANRAPREAATPWFGPQAALMGLQASVGNAAVAGLFRASPGTAAPAFAPARAAMPSAAGRVPTAPVVSRQTDEDAEDKDQAPAGEEAASTEDAAAGQAGPAASESADAGGASGAGGGSSESAEASSGAGGGAGESAADGGSAGDVGAKSGSSSGAAEGAAEEASSDAGQASGGESASGEAGAQDASADAGQSAADAGEAPGGESASADESASGEASDEGAAEDASADSGEVAGGESASGEASASGEGSSEDASADSGEASGGESASGESGTDDAGAEGEGGEREHTPEEQAEKEAEGQTAPESDEFVDTGGSGYPIAASTTHAPASSARFADGGRIGTVPFTLAQLDGYDPGQDLQPHAFAGGGRTGTKAWAGGGGAGPKGNQEAGSIQKEVIPDYDSSWGGLLTNASAWVIDGTGIVDVERNYVTSDAGDQGNGWWISDKAAAALDAHEQRHVANSRDQFNTNIGPVLDRIARSREIGKEITYKSVDAKAYVRGQIHWKAGLDTFKEADQGQNAPNMMVDTNDTASGALPRPQHGPRKIAGKTYDSYLIMNSEPDPS